MGWGWLVEVGWGAWQHTLYFDQISNRIACNRNAASSKSSPRGTCSGHPWSPSPPPPQPSAGCCAGLLSTCNRGLDVMGGGEALARESHWAWGDDDDDDYDDDDQPANVAQRASTTTAIQPTDAATTLHHLPITDPSKHRITHTPLVHAPPVIRHGALVGVLHKVELLPLRAVPHLHLRALAPAAALVDDHLQPVGAVGWWVGRALVGFVGAVVLCAPWVGWGAESLSEPTSTSGLTHTGK